VFRARELAYLTPERRLSKQQVYHQDLASDVVKRVVAEMKIEPVEPAAWLRHCIGGRVPSARLVEVRRP
jgi:hypothetical protein